MRLPAYTRRTFADHTPVERGLLLTISVTLFFGALVGVAAAAGFERVSDRLGSTHPTWLLLALAGEAAAYFGYGLAYREIARVEQGPEISSRRLAAAIATGFGAFVARGGFTVDLHAFRTAGVSEREARVRVLGLGALEYAVLAPAACGCAIALLAEGVSRPGLGLTLPWAVGVPLGFAFALWAVEHRHRFHGRGRWRDLIGQALDSIYVLRKLLVTPGHAAAPLGATLYWFGDIFCLWACLHAFGEGSPPIAQLVVGYATGYVLTRRTLPFGGAGAVEALLPFALHWAGVALAGAVLAVFAYRVLNLWLPLLPASAGVHELRDDY